MVAVSGGITSDDIRTRDETISRNNLKCSVIITLRKCAAGIHVALAGEVKPVIRRNLQTSIYKKGIRISLPEHVCSKYGRVEYIRIGLFVCSTIKL